MSKLHLPSLARIAKEADAEGLMNIFEAMIDEAEEFDNDVQQVCMPYIEDGDEFEEGTWVPELWFVVRKVLPDV